MKNVNDVRRIREIFRIAIGVLATFGCGPCPPSVQTIKVYTPPGNGPDAGGNSELPVLDEETCNRVCGENTITCSYERADAGDMVLVQCTNKASCGAGRRPPGFEAAAVSGPNALGLWLGQTADFEAASVDAFEILALELDAHGAPKALVRRAQAAAVDEVRHARMMRRLALRHGAKVGLRRKVVSGAPRSLRAIALENAVEGCVKEAFAALVATVQADQATDPAVRAAMTKIAHDETRHAALALAVDRFLRSKLDHDDTLALDAATATAYAALEHEAPVALAPHALAAAGLPEPEAMRVLARAFKTAAN